MANEDQTSFIVKAKAIKMDKPEHINDLSYRFKLIDEQTKKSTASRTLLKYFKSDEIFMNAFNIEIEHARCAALSTEDKNILRKQFLDKYTRKINIHPEFLLAIPKPRSKRCHVCRIEYEDYFTHKESQIHKNNFPNNSKLTNMVKMVHNDFEESFQRCEQIIQIQHTEQTGINQQSAERKTFYNKDTMMHIKHDNKQPSLYDGSLFEEKKEDFSLSLKNDNNNNQDLLYTKPRKIRVSTASEKLALLNKDSQQELFANMDEIKEKSPEENYILRLSQQARKDQELDESQKRKEMEKVNKKRVFTGKNKFDAEQTGKICIKRKEDNIMTLNTKPNNPIDQRSRIGFTYTKKYSQIPSKDVTETSKIRPVSPESINQISQTATEYSSSEKHVIRLSQKEYQKIYPFKPDTDKDMQRKSSIEQINTIYYPNQNQNLFSELCQKIEKNPKYKQFNQSRTQKQILFEEMKEKPEKSEALNRDISFRINPIKKVEIQRERSDLIGRYDFPAPIKDNERLPVQSLNEAYIPIKQKINPGNETFSLKRKEMVSSSELNCIDPSEELSQSLKKIKISEGKIDPRANESIRIYLGEKPQKPNQNVFGKIADNIVTVVKEVKNIIGGLILPDVGNINDNDNELDKMYKTFKRT